MKGLLIKDIQLILANKQMFIILLFVGIMQLVGNNANGFLFAVSYFTLVMGMVAISTISYDEFEEGTQFLLTLPITRKLYAISKYVILCCLSFTGWMIPIILGFVTTIGSGAEVYWLDWWLVRLVIWFTVNLIMLISLPIQLKYGSTHGRLVVFAFIALVVLIPVLGQSVLRNAGMDVGVIMNRIMVFAANLGSLSVTVGAAVLFLITLTISMQISIRVMEKKQY